MDLRGFFKKINETAVFAGLAEFNEPMAGHTTFKTGGLADLWVKPEKSIFINWTAAMLKAAKAEGVPVFILGGGANLLVADKGIRGIVLDTGFWEEISGAAPENAVKRKEGCELTAESLKAESLTAEVLTVKVLSGTSIDGLARNLAAKGLSGMQSFAGMPGSVGGAVWMNARCYDKSISDVLVKVEILNENFEVAAAAINKNDFSYKQSPFQKRDVLILSAYFMVEPGETVKLKKEMDKYIRDREEKGHYRFPSAGSVFKNNREFGEPSGKIIADLGMRGLASGGAQIAPWHGNFIINKDNAASADIKSLIEEIQTRVKKERGFDLEPEVLFIGEW